MNQQQPQRSVAIRQLQRQLKQMADKVIAEHSQRFFKTGPGEYGAGDRFRGIRVPHLRRLAKQYKTLTMAEVVELLHSAYHEDRLLALLIWVLQFQRGKVTEQKEIYRAYLKHTHRINNWDLVDTTAAHIVGTYLLERDKQVLIKLASSATLWERRIAVVATFHFIKHEIYTWTLQLAQQLIQDQQDLMHKAVGWMLREVGKKDEAVLLQFLDGHYSVMPRTMLRYAIERLPEATRQSFLQGNR